MNTRASHSSDMTTATTSTDEDILIREVWECNLAEEMMLISGIVNDYPYIAMDTEFPGVVLRLDDALRNHPEYKYAEIRNNVNLLKLIQLGLTFSDDNGNLPKCGTDQQCVWQFNFKEFNADSDLHSTGSIELLKASGIDFERNKRDGVDSNSFVDLFMSSGVVLNARVRWITFHGGFDFGYLIKLLMKQSLPDHEADFLNLFRIYFPVSYDVKYLIRFSKKHLHGGLNTLARLMKVTRVGPSHQAGSDSLLTSRVFCELKESYITVDIQPYSGILYGLGTNQNGTPSSSCS